jgi:hypothetical protein
MACIAEVGRSKAEPRGDVTAELAFELHVPGAMDGATFYIGAIRAYVLSLLVRVLSFDHIFLSYLTADSTTNKGLFALVTWVYSKYCHC